MGDLRLIDGYHPSNDFLKATFHDTVYSGFLKTLLFELGHNTLAEIVE